MAWEQRQYQAAIHNFEEAAALSSSFPIETRMLIYYRMRVALSQGQLALARTHMKNLKEVGTDASLQGKLLLSLGLLAAREDQMEEAANWFGIFEGWKQKHPWADTYPGAAWFLSRMEKIENDQALEQVREALGEEVYEAMVESHRHLTEDEIISLLRERLSELD